MDEVRLATPSDGPALAAIYAPIVAGTAWSFEEEPPDGAAMAARIQGGLATHPWLVLEDGGAVLGYAYASTFRSRPAYRYATEVSVYVAEDARRRGAARRLYRALFAVLRLQGFVTAYAVIALPNPASVALHERLGFVREGLLPAAGFKHGGWRDVGIWTLRLRELPAAPGAIRPLPELLGQGAFADALR